MKFQIILFAILISTNVFSQTLKKDVDALIKSNIPNNEGPGLVVLIAKKGKTIYKEAFGKANLELNVPMSTNHVFQIGSMTKQFTAISILLLEEQGKLKLNDLVENYIPNYPNGNKITIHHLLSHTAGLPDFTKFKGLREFAQTDHDASEVVEFFKSDTLEFSPGSKFSYSNTNYVLLGYIIEITSGMKYKEYIDKNIFQKIGMKSSLYSNDRIIVNNRAYGYHKKENGYVNKTIISYSVPYASGALMSSVDDLLIWQNALRDQRLLKSENSIKAFSKYTLSNGDSYTYGYGWHIKEIKGYPSREHGGSVFGYKSMGVYLPQQDIYVVGLSNCDCISPTQLIKDITEIVLKHVE